MERTYTPALGLKFLTPFYDAAIALLTREAIWREALVRTIDLKPGDRLLDVGCGTGSLAIRLAEAVPRAKIAGIDPDADVLRCAFAKARRYGVAIELHEGLLSDVFFQSEETFDVITSSLVLHQVPLPGKTEILKTIRKGLKPSGRICIADYGLQRTPLMRFLFRWTVQALDGVADTQPNAEGILPQLMASVGFSQVEEVEVFSTPTGSISIYRAASPAG
jgi:ubiquinone/menaquinone biosynthesis C-methylase UbiE